MRTPFPESSRVNPTLNCVIFVGDSELGADHKAFITFLENLCGAVIRGVPVSFLGEGIVNARVRKLDGNPQPQDIRFFP